MTNNQLTLIKLAKLLEIEKREFVSLTKEYEYLKNNINDENLIKIEKIQQKIDKKLKNITIINKKLKKLA